MQEELTKDMNNMENIMINLGDHSDIWQDRFIWAIAKAVYDGLKYLKFLKSKIDELEVHQRVGF